MYARFSFAYDFAKSGQSNAPGDARIHILDNIAHQITELSKAGIDRQVKGALSVDFSKQSFSLTCTKAFADKLGKRPGFNGMRRI